MEKNRQVKKKYKGIKKRLKGNKITWSNWVSDLSVGVDRVPTKQNTICIFLKSIKKISVYSFTLSFCSVYLVQLFAHDPTYHPPIQHLFNFTINFCGVSLLWFWLPILHTMKHIFVWLYYVLAHIRICILD